MIYPAFFCSKCGRDLSEELENKDVKKDLTCDDCNTIKPQSPFKGILGESNIWKRKK